MVGLTLRRILVPVDFTEAALVAVAYAVNLAHGTGAGLSLLHVSPKPVGSSGEAALRDAVQAFSQGPGHADVLIRQGDAAEQIVATACELHVDLIVMSTRNVFMGLPPVIGGTTRRVLRTFPGMCLTVSEQVHAPVWPPHHVTFVMTGNAASRSAFEVLRVLLLSTSAAVTLVMGIVRQPEADALNRLEDIKRHLMAYTRQPLVVEALVVPRSNLEASVARLKTDLIVVGRNETGAGVPELLSPTVRRLVRHATTPVLSIPSTRLEEVDRRFRAVTRTLTREELSRTSTGSSETDHFLNDLAGLASNSHSNLLLGIYGDQGLLDILERLGILERLRARGFDRFQVRIRKEDGRDLAQLLSGDALLVEVVEHVTSLVPTPWMHRIVGTAPFRVVTIEWVLMQNPGGTFSALRPPLPGQRKPGLGIGYEVAELFVLAAERLGCDGLLSYPQFYHNARLYHERFHFMDPEVEGRVLALERDTAGHSLAETSWAVELGLVSDERGRPYRWESHAQMLGITARGLQPFTSAEYRRGVRKALEKYSFSVDWAGLPAPDLWPGLETRVIGPSSI